MEGGFKLTKKMQLFQINIEDTLSESVKDIVNPWACYILYHNKTIHRLGGSDSKGVLYIGKADNLYNRIPSLQQSVLSNCNNALKAQIKGHQSLSKKVFRIKEFLDTSKMTISIVVLPTYESIMYTESYLLEYYVKKFGELPPLNGQYGKYEFDEANNYIAAHQIKLENIIDASE